MIPWGNPTEYRLGYYDPREHIMIYPMGSMRPVVCLMGSRVVLRRIPWDFSQDIPQSHTISNGISTH